MSKNTKQGSTRQQRQRLIEKLTRETNFKAKFEVECLLKKYAELSPKGKMERAPFREFLQSTFEMTDDIMMDRVFRAFDTDTDNKISEEEWVKGMSTFLKGTDRQKAQFCFTVYDLNGDNVISKDEMFHFLKLSFAHQKAGVEEDPDEGIKDLVDIVIKKLDKQQKGTISLNDFEEAVLFDDCGTLLLECLGKCLPDKSQVTEFETTTLAAS